MASLHVPVPRWVCHVVEYATGAAAPICALVSQLTPEASSAPYLVATCIAGVLLVTSQAAGRWVDHVDKKEKEQLEREKECQRERDMQDLKERHERQGREMIQRVLNLFYLRYFEKIDRTDYHRARATLFRCEQHTDEHGTAQKCLRVYARRGVFPESNCSWPVDGNDEKKCRGLAAQVWFTGTSEVRTAACDWSEDDPQQQELYASSLGITVEEARALNVKSRVFTGVQIVVHGRVWGVLLLDSRSEGHITDAKPKVELLSRYAQIFGQMLEAIES
jgi:hypothetical protein